MHRALSGDPAVAEGDHVASTQPAAVRQAGRPPATTRTDWRHAADRTIGQVARRRRSWLPRSSCTGSRCRWARCSLPGLSSCGRTRTTSARRRGCPRRCRTCSTLRLMTELAATTLPFGAVKIGLHGPINLRLVLTGHGGGTWDVAIGGEPPEPASVVIVTDVVGFCRLVANRVSPADLEAVRHRRPGPGGRGAGGGFGAGARLIRRRSRRRTFHGSRTHLGGRCMSVLVIAKFQGDTATFRQAIGDRAGEFVKYADMARAAAGFIIVSGSETASSSSSTSGTASRSSSSSSPTPTCRLHRVCRCRPGAAGDDRRRGSRVTGPVLIPHYAWGGRGAGGRGPVWPVRCRPALHAGPLARSVPRIPLPGPGWGLRGQAAAQAGGG